MDWCCASFSVPFFVFIIFFEHFLLFYFFLRFDHFCSDRLFCLLCFSCFSLRVYIVDVMYTPYTPTISIYDLWHPCADLTSWSSHFPPHTLVKNMHYGPICVSVCLVLCLLGANTSPCIHPNPHPPSWVPPYPFMTVRTYVSFWGKFPGHTWPEIIPC